MKNTKWFTLWLYFLLKLENIHSKFGITSCLSIGSCNEITVRNYNESTCHNPLYLIGKFNVYQLAIPRPIKTTDNDTDDEDSNEKKKKPTFGDVRLVYNGLKKLISACADESQITGRSKSFGVLIREVKNPSVDEVYEKCCPYRMDATPKPLHENCYVNPYDPSEIYTEYEMGFQVDMQSVLSILYFSADSKVSTWHPLYRICYNHKTRRTIYTTHTLHGVSMGTTSLRYGGDFRDLDKSDENEEFEYETIDKVYKKKYVENLFNTLFRSRKNKYADTGKNYLARGHLVPDADMSFVSWKIATYFYINVVPMWQQINNGNWKAVERKIRHLAKELQRDLVIYTGTYGILKYDEQEIFLFGADSGKLPIPAYLWKVVYDKEENNAIALVIANDPYMKITLPSPCLSEDASNNMCSEFKWNWGNNMEYKTTIICCEVKTLMENVPYAPRQLKNVNPLYYPEKKS